MYDSSESLVGVQPIGLPIQQHEMIQAKLSPEHGSDDDYQD